MASPGRTVVVVAGMAGAAWNCWGVGVDPAGNVESVRRFLSNPPVVRSLVFSLEKPLTTTNGVEFFHAKWQSNGFFVRLLPDPTFVGRRFVTMASVPVVKETAEGGTVVSAVASTNVAASPAGGSTGDRTADTNARPVVLRQFCIGWYEREAWRVDQDGNHPRFTFNLANGLPITETNRPPDTEFFLNLLSQIVNLGIPDLGIGTIRWRGDEFAEVSSVTSNLLKGTLVISNGVVRGARFSIHSTRAPRPNEPEWEPRQYEIEYEYQRELSPTWRIPSTITTYLRMAGKLTVFSRIGILEADFGEAAMDREAMGPRSILSPSARVFEVRKDAVYEQIGSEMIRSYDNAYAAQYDPGGGLRVRYLAMVGFLVVGMALLGMRRVVTSARRRERL